MPSVLGLMERREARARQDLESWTEVLEQAQAEVNAAQERVERARVGREELVSVLAEESTVNSPVSVPSGGAVVTAVGSSGSGAGYGEQPSVWRSGMGEEVLSGLYRVRRADYSETLQVGRIAFAYADWSHPQRSRPLDTASVQSQTLTRTSISVPSVGSAWQAVIASSSIPPRTAW